MNKTAKYSLNRIIILESLEPDETSTGKELYEDTIYYKRLENNIQIESVFYKIETKNELTNLLKNISYGSKKHNIKPILHIEAHGDNNGLELNSGKSKEYIKWEELAFYLKKINIACKNNLFVSLAVCSGAFLAENSMAHLDRAVFWGMIGFEGKIFNYKLSMFFKSFYSELLTSFNLKSCEEAIQDMNKKMNSRYHLWTSEWLFSQAFLKYLINNCSTQVLKERSKKVINKNIELKQKNKNERHRLEKLLYKEFENTDNKVFHKKCSDKFMMIDLYPELCNRKTYSYNDILDKYNEYKKTLE